jgi:O-antigen ligase
VPEHIKAMVVVLALSAMVFFIARPHTTALAIAPEDYARRRNLWIIVTLIAFLSGSFWLYVILTAAVLMVASQRERSPVTLFLALVFAVPPVTAQVTGFGVLEHTVSLNHVRLLSLLVLLPAFLSLVRRPDTMPFGRLWPDRLLLGYLIVNFGVMLYVTTFTNVLRHGVVYAFIDIFLPYYVAGRSLKTIKDFRELTMTFVVVGMVLSAIAVFEMGKHWLLYFALISALDVSWAYGNYVPRLGFALRAQATTGQPIVLGFVLAVALVLALYARTSIASVPWRRLGICLLVAGLFAAISRGPWLGALFGVLAFVATGQGAGRQFAKYAVLAGTAMPFIRLVPGVDALIDLLPFVGTTEAHNIEYRRRLLETAMDAIWRSPWFGGIDIYSAEGSQSLILYGYFIDVVNSYVEVALVSGLVGLTLFAGFFGAVAIGIWRGLKAITDTKSEEHLLGRALLAAIACVAVTIFTVSSITFIPTVYWTLGGIGFAWICFHRRSALADATRLAKVAVPRRDRPHSGKGMAVSAADGLRN